MKSGWLDWLAYWAVRLFAFLVRRLPMHAAYAVGRFAGYVYFFFSGRRRAAYADLKAAFGDRYKAKERWKIARAHYAHIGQSFIEMIHFSAVTEQNVLKEFDVPDIRYADEADKGPSGLIYLTAHLGNWELLVTLADAYGKPMHALSRVQKFSRLNSLLNEFRKKRGSKVVSKGMGIRDLLKALRDGDRVGVLGDQSAGKYEGVILSFFGRKTTVPTGAFDLASRTGAVILPSFVVRQPGESHKVHLEKPFICPSLSAAALTEHVKNYLKILENLISANPDQWLWAKKRWKYSWTKRLLILSDGKRGHLKQSQAVAQIFYGIPEQFGRPGMEYPTETVEVKYRSGFARAAFAVFAFFFHPWAQGRLGMLQWFFEEKTWKAVMSAGCDFVISSGSSLTPLNLCIARENLAKSIVCMKPSFPYNFLEYGLAIVPSHDGGTVPRDSIRTLLTPSASLDREMAAGDIRSRLRDISRVRIGVFLGGPSHDYKIDKNSVEVLLKVLQESSADAGDFLLTTSRRTPSSISDYLEQSRQDFPACQLLVVALKDPSTGVVESLLDLSEIAIVTEDSISMISEAVRAGKKVVVLSWGDSRRLPKKHQRFLSGLESSGTVKRATPEMLASEISRHKAAVQENPARHEEELLRRRLQEIL